MKGGRGEGWGVKLKIGREGGDEISDDERVGKMEKQWW